MARASRSAEPSRRRAASRRESRQREQRDDGVDLAPGGADVKQIRVQEQEGPGPTADRRRDAAVSQDRGHQVGEADVGRDHRDLDGEVVDQEVVTDRVEATVDQPQQQRPRRRIPHRVDHAETGVVEHAAQVQGHVRVVAAPDQVAGGHEDAGVVGVPEHEPQAELQADAQHEHPAVGCRRPSPAPTRRRAAAADAVAPRPPACSVGSRAQSRSSAGTAGKRVLARRRTSTRGSYLKLLP